MYYEVWVRSAKYRGTEPLTYEHGGKLAVGSIVRVPLRNEQVLGFVGRRVKKPGFVVKPITEILLLPRLPESSISLAVWLRQFYVSTIGTVTSQILPGNLRIRDLKPIPTEQAPELSEDGAFTAEQQAALDMITKPDTYLLHGRTGSGKTRIYIELARRQIEVGKSALILSPEIGLTSQLAATFRRTFGERVLILHSRLTAKEREEAWLRILCATEPQVIIGPRSALFSPIRNLGLIAVDESHDQAYKQEQAPYYNTIHVAAELRLLHGAILVLGSATPSIVDYYLATERQKPIIRLNSLAIDSSAKREITIVDFKDRSEFSRTPHISRTLTNAIAGSLRRGEQALLYLNRRGTARLTVCNSCGWQALCPHCDLPLAYHGDKHLLLCHMCGYKQAPIITCPTCSSQSVAFKSFGTKAIVEEAQRLFPEARILRLDTDSSSSERLENQYANIREGSFDILVGTQMLTKGLDLPRLSTLGIVLADSSLYLPDFTAQERTYQLLTQVIGRIGRGHVSSHAVIQTFQPESPILGAALNDDWETFYNNELAERHKYLFPPFCHLLKLSCRRASAQSAERAMSSFKKQILQQKLHVLIDGPAPSFHEKAGGQYVWQMVVKSRNRSSLQEVITVLPNNWSYDIDPADLL